MYVYLAGGWHPIADDEHTPCGLLVPHGTDWTHLPGGSVHCGPDATPEPEPEPEPEPVVKKAKKKGDG